MRSTRFSWDESKRRENLEKHGVDFAAIEAFDWETALVFEDTRQGYGEQRFVAFGRIGQRLHVAVWTPRGSGIRVISLRKANVRENKSYALSQL